MPTPILYGAAYSVYVRAARMALAEKGVPYRLVEVDVFAPTGPPAEHLARQPFGKIPAFEHDGFTLYETGAITRYVDEAFDGPALQPASPRARARMTQAIGVLDAYVYPDLVWGVYVERAEPPRRVRSPDEARIARTPASPLNFAAERNPPKWKPVRRANCALHSRNRASSSRSGS